MLKEGDTLTMMPTRAQSSGKRATLKKKAISLFKPSLSDVAEDLAEEMIESMPH